MKGATLTVQLAGQPPFPVKAVGPADFVFAAVGAKVRFVLVGGKVIAMEILHDGHTLPGTRN